MVGFYEVCPLKALPKVDNVYVSGSADDQIRPEWEQSAARRVLGVESVVISGAGHANIFTKAKYAAQLAHACLKGLCRRRLGHNPHCKRSAGRVEKVLGERQAVAVIET